MIRWNCITCKFRLGQIVLADGSKIRVGYADQKRAPFRSVAGLLIRRGEIKAQNASIAGIREMGQTQSEESAALSKCQSEPCVFQGTAARLAAPLGTQGVPLTAERSIAIDPRVIPLGVPLYLSTTHPTREPLNRLMVAQDTGGAIAGAVRGDFTGARAIPQGETPGAPNNR